MLNLYTIVYCSVFRQFPSSSMWIWTMKMIFLEFSTNEVGFDVLIKKIPKIEYIIGI